MLFHVTLGLFTNISMYTLRALLNINVGLTMITG